jgi:hypothetical protein
VPAGLPDRLVLSVRFRAPANYCVCRSVLSENGLRLRTCVTARESVTYLKKVHCRLPILSRVFIYQCALGSMNTLRMTDDRVQTILNSAMSSYAMSAMSVCPTPAPSLSVLTATCRSA